MKEQNDEQVAEMLAWGETKRERVVELLARLSPQMGAFCYHFIRTLNPKEAALLAGMSAQRSKNAAAFLSNPSVKELVALLLETQITKEEVIGRIVDIARFDYGTLLSRNEETGLLQFDLEKAKAEGQTAAIKSFSYGKQGVRVEVYDKLAALQVLAKHLGLLNDKIEGTSNGALKVLVEHVKREVEKEDSDA